MTIADNLKRLRARAGLSQADLAVKAGVSQQLISQIELGKNVATTKLAALAVALVCRPEEIDPALAGASSAVAADVETLRSIMVDLAKEDQQRVVDFAIALQQSATRSRGE